MKKKILTLATIATILGLSFYSASHTKVDEKLGTESKAMTTYIVAVDGDVKNDDAEKLAARRNTVLSQIAYMLPEDSYEITHVYDTVYNGFSIKTSAANKELLNSITYVKGVNEEHTYAAPEADEGDGTEEGATGDLSEDEVRKLKFANYSAQTMNSTDEDVEAVLAANNAPTSEKSKQGRGVRIGIIDTGMYINQIAGTDERTEAEEKAATTKGLGINKAAFLDLSDEDTFWNDSDIRSSGLSHGYTRFNNKIPFAFDYANQDVDVDPTEAGSEHGTHVASIAAANGEDMKGVAPMAQIAVMKVFGDDQGGASTSAIIAALEDAVKLKLDIVNLSLGTDLYDYDDEPDEASNVAAKACRDAGVIVNYSAGNSGKSSFSGTKGYADWSTETVETGIIGSHANVDEYTNIVASSNPNKAFYSSIMTVTKTGESTAHAVSFSDQVKNSTTQTFDEELYLADTLIPEGETTATVQYQVVPGYGQEKDYENVDVKGKIAVVNRGSSTFVDKVTEAYAHGAIAMVCINNEPSVTFNFTMAFNDYSPKIPVVWAFQNTKEYFGDALTTGSITISKNSVEEAADGNIISSYSSDGASFNLDMGPTISAPGSNIIGAINALSKGETSTEYGYDNFSGTSMASPNLSGAMALVLGEKLPQNNGTLKLADADEYLEEKKMLSAKAMSTADQLVDASGTKTPGSPRLQGAGRVDAKGILSANAYLTTPNNDLGGYDNDVQSKAELKNTGSLYVKDGDFANSTESNYVEFEYTVHNESDEAKTYTPSLSVMIPDLRVQVTHETYANEEIDSRKETVGFSRIDNNSFNADDPDTYPMFVGTPTQSINDQMITVPEENIESDATVTVAANSTATAKVKVRIDNLQMTKDWGDSMVDNFSGTLKEYFAKYFNEGGGSYVEGYLTLTENGSDDVSTNLVMPYMGFYGDYSVASAVEPFDFEKDERHTYNSDLIDNYLHNLSSEYAKPNAYVGSTLAAAGSFPTSTALSNVAAFQTSLLADGQNYLSVVGDTNEMLYAGASGVADKLIATFFMNRSVDDANWYIQDASGNSVASGQIGDLYTYSGTTQTSYASGLCKSWLVTDDTSYVIHKGYAEIDLKKVPEGVYNLVFDFHVKGPDVHQKKTYPITVDKTAPELEDVSVYKDGEDNILKIVAKGANSTATVNNARTRSMKKVSGTDDDYSTEFVMSDSWISNDKCLIELTDYAHNSSTVLIHPSEVDFALKSTFFTTKNNFSITQYSSRGGRYSYEVVITDAKGNDITNLKEGYDVYVRVAAGLDPDEISVMVDGEDVDTEYDAETGWVTIHFAADSANFSINRKLASESSGGDDSSATSESTSSQEEPAKKSGCGGSVVASGATIGAVALLGLALGMKKKEEK